MPRLRKPQSAIDRLVFLKEAVETANNYNAKGQSHITPKSLKQALELIPKLESAMGKLGSHSSLKQKEVREKNSSLSVLQTYMRDIWAGKRRQVYRENLPIEVFAFYQMQQDGKTPDFTTEGQWMETTEFMIQGESDAIAAGYSPVTNPTMDELKEKLEIARKEYNEVSEADKLYDKAQEAVSELMPEAKSIIDRIIAELNYHLYDMDDPSRRRIMRNYGVRYEYTINEQTEDDSDITLN